MGSAKDNTVILDRKEYDELQDRIDELETKLWHAKGALGYPVPGHIGESDQFRCGICESKERRVIEKDAQHQTLIEVIKILAISR